MYLNLDENNYLLSITSVGNGIEIEIDLDDYDLSGNRINAYKYENGLLIFDSDKFDILEAERIAREKEEKNTITPEKRITELESAMELLLSGETEEV